MAIKNWMKVQHWKYTNDRTVIAMWMYKDGSLLTLQKTMKGYYIDYSGTRSILLLTSHHPQEPIKTYRKALMLAKRFMRKY